MLELTLFPLVTPRRAAHGGVDVTCGYGMRLADGFAVEATDPLLAGFGVVVPCVDSSGREDPLQDDAFAPGSPVLLLPSVDAEADEVSVWSADGVQLAGIVDGAAGEQLAAALAFGASLTAHVLTEECGAHDGVRQSIDLVAGPSAALAVTVEPGELLRPARTQRVRLVLIADGSTDVDLWDPTGRRGPVDAATDLALSPELRSRVMALREALADVRTGEEPVGGMERTMREWDEEALDQEARLVWRRLRAELGRRCEIGFLGREMARPVWDPDDVHDDDDDG